MNIKKGDTVQVMVGKDRGKTGKVLRIDVQDQRVLVENVNLYKKHSRPKKQGEKGEIVSLSRPLNRANVLLYCSNCRRGVRIGQKFEKGSKKVRYCKKCEVSL